MVSQGKIDALKARLSELDSVVVAFSGGADSTLLLAMSLEVLGPERVLAVTANSPTLPESELEETRMLAGNLGVEHKVIDTEELDDPRFASNPRDRCYYCKRELFERLWRVAEEEGFRHVVYGATAADTGDHRPGMEAAEEAGAMAPLLQAEFSKQDVRDLARERGLPTWNKPAMACLASRFPYGDAISREKLLQVEKAEHLLRNGLDFREVRVRHHGTVARIEIDPTAFGRLLDEPTRKRVVSELKGLGYVHVALDLEGFRSGSMNEVLYHHTKAHDGEKTFKGGKADA